jgi:hypothetical protein
MRGRMLALAGLAMIAGCAGTQAHPSVGLAGKNPPGGHAHYVMTVALPSRHAANGLMARGAVNGKRWQAVIDPGLMGQDTMGCMKLGQTYHCGPQGYAAPRSVEFFECGDIGRTWQFCIGNAGVGVTNLVITFSDGTSLSLRPASAYGLRWLAFAAPRSLTVGQATAFADGSELSYTSVNGKDGLASAKWVRSR